MLLWLLFFSLYFPCRCRLNWILTHRGQKQNYGTCYKFAYESVNVTFSHRIFYELDGKNYDIFSISIDYIHACSDDFGSMRTGPSRPSCILLWQIDEWTNRRKKKMKWNKIKTTRTTDQKNEPLKKRQIGIALV